MAGVVGVSGCLRLTSDGTGSGAGGSDTDTGTASDGGGQSGSDPDGGSSSDSGGGGLFPPRSEAIASVAGFADSGDVVPVEPYSGPDAELIRYSSGWGSSWGSGPDGSVETASDLQVEPVGEEGIPFAGDSNRRLRVRNLTLDATLTFEPDPDADAARVTEFSIDPGSEGRPPSEIGLELGDGGQERRRIGGTWTGDEDMFRRQAIGTFVVELLENGTVIGRTAGGIYGTHYRWAAQQTADALYVTRQPSVREAWVAELVVGDNTFDPQARVAAEQVVDENVFRVDTTGLDVDAGQYDWTLMVGSDRPVRDNGIIHLTPLDTSLIVQ